MKRILNIFSITIACLLTSLSIFATEEDIEAELKDGDTFVADGMTYKVMSATDKTCELTNGKDDDVVLSPKVNHNGISYTLISIGASAFAGNSLSSIEIPYSVTTIGNRAFRKCYQLKSLTIAESTSQVVIGSEAFEYCTSLTQVYLPSSVVSIYSQAFHYCSKIENITINNRNPSNIYVGSEALNYSSTCILNVPKGCKSLYETVAYWKNFSQIVEMPELNAGETFAVDGMTYKVTSTSDKTCELTKGKDGSIVIPEEVQSYTVTSIGQSAFSSMNISSIVIPSCIKEIGRYAFSSCTLPAILIIPEGIKSIGASAFAYGKGLSCVILPSTLERLGNDAFNSNDNILETVLCFAKSAPTLFSTVEQRFYRLSMHKIKLLCMPDSDVDSYKKYYDYDDDGAWRKFEKKIAKDWTGYIIEGGIVYGVTGNELYVCHVDDTIEDVVIPDKVDGKSVKGIYYDFNSKTNHKSIKFPKNMDTFDTTFGSCYSLTSVELPDNITTLPQNMFYSCRALVSINIPDKTTVIEDNAFYSCSNLETIDLPAGVASIGYAFNGCKGIRKVVSRNVNPPAITQYTFWDVDKSCCVLRVPYESLDKYKVADYWKEFQVVKSIEGYELVKVAEIQFPEGNCTINKGETHQFAATVLPANADDKTLTWTSSNTSVATVDAEGNVTAINKGTVTITAKANDGSGTSASCKVTVIIPYCDSPVFVLNGTKLTIGSTTPGASVYYTIGGAVPTETSTKYTAPMTLTSNSIVKAIAYAENHLPSAVSSFTPELDHTFITFYVENAGKKIYYKSTSSTTCQVLANDYSGDVVIPEEVTYNGTTYKVTSIGGKAFYNCTELTSIVMPSGVTSIGDDAFYFCSSLKEIEMPRSLLTVGDNIFAGCFITSLTCNYPYETDGVSLIDSRTKTLDCYYNGNVERYSVPAGVKTIRKWGFYRWGNLRTLTLPEGLETIEHAILLDCYNVEFVNIPSTVTYIGDRIFEGPRNVKPSVLVSVPDPKQITLQASPFNNSINWNLFVPEGCVDAYKNATQWIERDYNKTSQNKVYESKFSEYNYNNNYKKQCKLQYEIIPGKACKVMYATELQSFSTAVDIKQTISYADRTFDITEIGESAFENKTDVSSITLSDSIKVIGKNAFKGCYNLQRLTSQSETPPIVESGAFYGVYKSSCILKVPFESIEAYKAADGWKDFSQIEGIVSPVTKLDLNETSITLNKGEKSQLTVVVTPSFADDKSVIWSSSNTSVATVDSNGKVTAVGVGSAKITVTANGGVGITACCDIRVILPTCDKPTFSFTDNNLAISSSTKSATIYYTLDGTTPTKSSEKYNSPISLTKNCTVKAIAIKDDFNNSSLATFGVLIVNQEIALSTNNQESKDWGINIENGGVFSVVGTQMLKIKTLTLYLNEINAGAMINNCDYVTVENIVARFTVSANTWHFITPMSDVNIDDVTHSNDGAFIFRQFDAAKRAQNDKVNCWADVTDGVLHAGQGYILRSNKAGEVIMPMLKVGSSDVFCTTDRSLVLNSHAANSLADEDWNYVGNPYPCYFNIQSMDCNAPVTVREGNKYTAYTVTDDSYTLRPMQAFFVQKPDNANAILFHKEGRVSAASKVRSKMPMDSGRKVFDILLHDGESADRTRVVINDNALLEYERECDAAKFDSEDADAAQIYSIGECGTRFAINERPMLDGVVGLGLTLGRRGVYTISLGRGNDAVRLHDAETQQTVDLNTESYEFTASAGECRDRFYLYFDEATGIDAVHRPSSKVHRSNVYNLNGQAVGKDYKGIVISNGKKIVR